MYDCIQRQEGKTDKTMIKLQVFQSTMFIDLNTLKGQCSLFCDPESIDFISNFIVSLKRYVVVMRFIIEVLCDHKLKEVQCIVSLRCLSMGHS